MVIKICGLTNAADARFALDAGADWVGLNLVAGPRKLPLDEAVRIAKNLDDPSRAVALVRATAGLVNDTELSTLRDCGVRRVQLYGDVSATTIDQIKQAGLDAIVVQAISGDASIAELDELLKTLGDLQPAHLLLDAHAPGKQGGTGRRADWNAIRKAQGAGLLSAWPPLLLAGGLTPDNVASAIKSVTPAGVDVSSGVEASPGKKDHVKVLAFVNAVRGATT